MYRSSNINLSTEEKVSELFANLFYQLRIVACEKLIYFNVHAREKKFMLSLIFDIYKPMATRSLNYASLLSNRIQCIYICVGTCPPFNFKYC